MAKRDDLVAGGDEFLRLEAREGDVLGELLEELADLGFAATLAGRRNVRAGTKASVVPSAFTS